MDKAVYIRGTHPYAFRTGFQAQIIGVEMVEIEGLETRPCFWVRFADGKHDHIPVSDYVGGNYVLEPYNEQYRWVGK